MMDGREAGAATGSREPRSPAGGKDGTMEVSAVGIGVGLHPGYGPAQRRDVRRGSFPDARGASYDDRPVKRLS
jgi:hypothetical protein